MGQHTDDIDNDIQDVQNGIEQVKSGIEKASDLFNKANGGAGESTPPGASAGNEPAAGSGSGSGSGAGAENAGANGATKAAENQAAQAATNGANTAGTSGAASSGAASSGAAAAGGAEAASAGASTATAAASNAATTTASAGGAAATGASVGSAAMPVIGTALGAVAGGLAKPIGKFIIGLIILGVFLFIYILSGPAMVMGQVFGLLPVDGPPVTAKTPSEVFADRSIDISDWLSNARVAAYDRIYTKIDSGKYDYDLSMQSITDMGGKLKKQSVAYIIAAYSVGYDQSRYDAEEAYETIRKNLDPNVAGYAENVANAITNISTIFKNWVYTSSEGSINIDQMISDIKYKLTTEDMVNKLNELNGDFFDIKYQEKTGTKLIPGTYQGYDPVEVTVVSKTKKIGTGKNAYEIVVATTTRTYYKEGAMLEAPTNSTYKATAYTSTSVSVPSGGIGSKVSSETYFMPTGGTYDVPPVEIQVQYLASTIKPYNQKKVFKAFDIYPMQMYENTSETVESMISIQAANLMHIAGQTADSEFIIGGIGLEDMVWPFLDPDSNYVKDWPGPVGYYGAPRDGGTRIHVGVDICANHGTGLYAVVNGVVVTNAWNNGGGNMVEIRDAAGYTYRYLHMAAPSELAVGTTVYAGQTVIGYCGGTGGDYVDHLHMSIYLPGSSETIDPTSYLKAAQERFEGGMSYAIGVGGNIGTMINNVTTPSGLTASQIEAVLKPALKGLGSTYISAEQTYGINAIFLMAINRQESANGTSELARTANNLGGTKWTGSGSYISKPSGKYQVYSSKSESVMETARNLSQNYVTPGGKYYCGFGVGSIGPIYCPDGSGPTHWIESITNLMIETYKSLGFS